MRGKVAVALTATDIRGLSPLSYAALRYGPQGGVYLALRELARLAEAVVDDVMMEFVSESYKNHEGVDGGEENGQGEVESGGWSEATLGGGLRGDPDRCDILEVNVERNRAGD